MNNDNGHIRKSKEENNVPTIKPDPETLHTTDPQEEMEGPVSSVMQASKEVIDENSGKVDKEAE